MSSKTKTLEVTTLVSILLLAACSGPAGDGRSPATNEAVERESEMSRDPHSYARPDEVAVSHLDLDLTVDFERHVLRGRASLALDNKRGATELHLDTRQLDVERVTLDDAAAAVDFVLGEEDPILGRELVVPIDAATRVVHVDYATRPEAAALQWLAPAQTAGRHPFLFTQSQAILARTWVPCQDTPAVRMTYDATVRVPPALMAVMSAENPTARNDDGVYRFRMPQPIPSYLLALAVGDLAFAELGPRTGVYAEPPLIERAAYEFAETEDMMTAVEKLYGPYRWGRYDLLVLPPSFPFGGMENPRLTFATPTIIAGDRSLTALVAHELAHSWSGNLVTNATWNDFWLNEGFTVYLEQRIMEAVKGRDYAEMLASLSLQDLEQAIDELEPRDTHLYLDLAGRDPDEGMTDVPYNKGYFFLRMIEETVGRERFDPFLRGWFEKNAFHSRTTADFVAYLRRELVAGDAGLEKELMIDAWVYGPGLPPNVPRVHSARFDRVDGELARFRDGAPAAELATEGWTTHEWLRFLRGLPDELPAPRMAELDEAFGFTASGNSEILHAWLHHVIRNRYEPAYPTLEHFLKTVGRRKFLKPLYERLAETEEGKAWAREIYAQARPGYHAVSSSTIDEILDWQG
ncbi:MAG: M1 family peptidase [Acidobacteria bacterium]|nr:MAG: M1 family peptidase [Acidobacteriota bacterium]